MEIRPADWAIVMMIYYWALSYRLLIYVLTSNYSIGQRTIAPAQISDDNIRCGLGPRSPPPSELNQEKVLRRSRSRSQRKHISSGALDFHTFISRNHPGALRSFLPTQYVLIRHSFFFFALGTAHNSTYAPCVTSKLSHSREVEVIRHEQ